MDVIEFAEKIRGAKLTDSEKESLRVYERSSLRCKRMIFDHHKTLRNLPRKCEFCEFDRGPYAQRRSLECADCRYFDKFQVKERMHPRQAYEWELYKQLKGEEA